MTELDIDPDILLEITNKFMAKSPLMTELVTSNERLIREINPDHFVESNENNNTR
jgi:hypothetical protein